jgi:hypothetical protein
VTPLTRPGIALGLTDLTSTLPASGAAPDSPFVLVHEALARGVRFVQRMERPAVNQVLRVAEATP